MKNLREILEKVDKSKLYFYGASQMLPVILYHLKLKSKFVKSIIDDDNTKNNLSYNNINLKIKNMQPKLNIKDLTFLITAPDNAAAITSKLLKLRPKKYLI